MTPPLKLSNPDASVPAHSRAKMQANVNKDLHKYLILLALPHHNAAQCLIATLLHRFVEEMHRRNIPAFFTEDNETRAAEILADLNFNGKSNPEQRTQTRRSSSRPPNPPKQPRSKDSRRGRTTPDSAGITADGDAATDNNGTTP